MGYGKWKDAQWSVQWIWCITGNIWKISIKPQKRKFNVLRFQCRNFLLLMLDLIEEIIRIFWKIGNPNLLLRIHFPPQKAIHHDPRKTRESFKILHQNFLSVLDRLKKRSERRFWKWPDFLFFHMMRVSKCKTTDNFSSKIFFFPFFRSTEAFRKILIYHWDKNEAVYLWQCRLWPSLK